LRREENAEPAYAKSFGVASVERPTSNIECNRLRDSAFSFGRYIQPIA
jgi:hypothetical protein